MGKQWQRGSSFAAFSLAGLYQRGQGVAQSDEKAFSLYQMAAEDERHPNAYAMVELGRMCRTETGTGDSGVISSVISMGEPLVPEFPPRHPV